jgi:hypothetical protein
MSKLSTLSRISRQPSLAYYYAQKALRSPGLRHALGGAVAGLVGQPPVAPGVEGAADVAQQLQVDGLCFLPQLELDAVQLQQVHAQLRDKPVFDLYDGQRFDIGQDVPADRIKLSYRSGDLLRCPPLLALANSPLIVDAVTRVLGARPTIGWFESWWTLGEKNAAGRKLLDDVYHRDVDDLRFVKLFAYLTDTDVANGAHSFVRGSHRSSLLTRRGPISDEQVRAAFAPQDILTITGKAGTVFLENTWGIHRPLLATQGRRLIFSALYGLTPWVPRGPHHTVSDTMPPGIDPYVNRALFSARP